MIVEERMRTYINSLDMGNTPFLEALEQEALENYRPGDILVIHHTTNELLPVLKEVAGIITETAGTNSHAAIVGMALEIPVLVGAKNAVSLLKSGATVTLDAERGIVMAI